MASFSIYMSKQYIPCQCDLLAIKCFFLCQFTCTIFIHQEGLVTSSVFCQRSSLVLWRETDMADERSENLEQLVRRIVHSVNRNETSNSNGNGSASNSVENRASTVEEELNQRFLLPRGVPSNDSTHAQDVTAQFNPNNNYGYTNYRSRQPSRQRNTPYGFSRQETSTSRASYSRRGSRERPAKVSTMKGVILLPHPTTMKVAKFHHKLRPQRCGLISDGCAIERVLLSQYRLFSLSKIRLRAFKSYSMSHLRAPSSGRDSVMR